MKVWIVEEGIAYEGAEVIGIYDSEEKAQARIDLKRKHHLSRYFPLSSMEKWTTDDIREAYDAYCGEDKYWHYFDGEVE